LVIGPILLPCKDSSSLVSCVLPLSHKNLRFLFFLIRFFLFIM
jgi:hypothetical protein